MFNPKIAMVAGRKYKITKRSKVPREMRKRLLHIYQLAGPLCGGRRNRYVLHQYHDGTYELYSMPSWWVVVSGEWANPTRRPVEGIQ